jgi:hypothetical protein
MQDFGSIIGDFGGRINNFGRTMWYYSPEK